METGRRLAGWWPALRRRWRSPAQAPQEGAARVGLALGGGFARGIAHIGVLRAFERAGIPIACIAGVSAGSMVAAAYASGASSEEIAAMARSMRFGDVARWTIARLGFAGSDRMAKFLRRLLKHDRFEEMRIPLGVVATDLLSGEAVLFRDSGDVILPIRASCSYPGLFQPVPYQNRLLVDGAMSMEIPAAMTRDLGATRVVAVNLPLEVAAAPPPNMFAVVNRCFQIMQRRAEGDWRRLSDVVITPHVQGVGWDGFESADRLIEAGEQAAQAALPAIRQWRVLEQATRILPPHNASPQEQPLRA